MLLGVLLALAAGTIVIFIVSQATTSGTQVVTVVVAKQDLPAGTILSVDTSDKTHMLITDAFVQKQVSADFVPENAFAFTTPDALNLELNNKVVVGTFYNGEILRHPDPRLVPLGTGSQNSLTNLNPAQLPAGSVLMVVQLQGPSNAKPVAVAGDYVDFIVSECNLPGAKDTGGGCESQTTLQNVYVYDVEGTSIVVVLSHQKALLLQYLENTGKGDIVVRKPGDSDPANTSAVTGSDIVKAFGY
jgi:Flp pilus assembly protein CpaB